MATKTAKTATTTNTTKEITMPEKNNLANRVALHNELFATISTADVTPTDDVTNCCPDKTIDNLTDDPVEQEFLRYVCGYFGWEPELCTESQAKANGGTLKDGAQGWPAVWQAKTTKSGPNAGKTSTWCQYVYPKSAFEWKDGAPAYDEEKKLRDDVEKAKKALAKAEKALDRYLHPEKYAKKAKQPTKAQLLAALAAKGISIDDLVA